VKGLRYALYRAIGRPGPRAATACGSQLAASLAGRVVGRRLRVSRKHARVSQAWM